MSEQRDIDPAETREWLDSLEGVIEVEGQDRAAFLLDELLARARRRGTPVPYSAATPYLNTIDRKSTRLNSSHANMSYAVFSLKKRYAQGLPSDSHRAGPVPENLTAE